MKRELTTKDLEEDIKILESERSKRDSEQIEQTIKQEYEPDLSDPRLEPSKNKENDKDERMEQRKRDDEYHKHLEKKEKNKTYINDTQEETNTIKHIDFIEEKPIIDEIDEVRNNIESVTHDAILSEKPLVIRSFAGSGKSITSCMTATKRTGNINEKYVILSNSINQSRLLKEQTENITGTNWPHILGWDSFLTDDEKKEFEEFKQYGISISTYFRNLLANKYKGILHPYNEQFTKIKDGMFGQFAHLPFLSNKINTKEFILILDENFFDSLYSKDELNRIDLERFVNSMTNFINRNNSETAKKLILIADILYDVIDKDINMENEELIKELQKNFLPFWNNELKIFKFIYDDYRDNIFFINKDKKLWFRDIYDTLVHIIDEVNNYKEGYTSFRLQTTNYINNKGIKMIDTKFMINYIDFNKYKEIFENYENVIILDASTNERLYNLFFDKLDIWRKIYNSDKYEKLKPFIYNTPDLTEEMRDIIQFIDGNYFRKSLGFENTYKRVVDTVKYILKENKVNQTEQVNIISFKNVGINRDDLGNMFIQSLFEYNIKYKHFGDLKGNNEMQNSRFLFIVGNNEVNINYIVDDMKSWFIGNKVREHTKSPLNENDYIIKDKIKYYKDEWINLFTYMKRENEIEQAVDRLRFLQQPYGKKCYLFTKMAIRFNTKRTLINDFTNIKMVKDIELDSNIIRLLKIRDYKTIELFVTLNKVGTYKHMKERIQKLISDKKIYIKKGRGVGKPSKLLSTRP